jgi:hypothetical protein
MRVSCKHGTIIPKIRPACKGGGRRKEKGERRREEGRGQRAGHVTYV